MSVFIRVWSGDDLKNGVFYSVGETYEHFQPSSQLYSERAKTKTGCGVVANEERKVRWQKVTEKVLKWL
jgi:hypothetical protein